MRRQGTVTGHRLRYRFQRRLAVLLLFGLMLTRMLVRCRGRMPLLPVLLRVMRMRSRSCPYRRLDRAGRCVARIPRDFPQLDPTPNQLFDRSE